MIAAHVINADYFRVRIAAVETGAPFNHVNDTVGTNLKIHGPSEHKAGQKRIDFEHAAVVIDLHFFDKIPRPFPDEESVVEIGRQFGSDHDVGFVVINGAAHGSAAAGTVNFWKLDGTVVRIPNPGGLSGGQIGGAGVIG